MLTINEFLVLVLVEYPIDQLALLVTWMNESDDEVHYFCNWLDLGDKVESLIRDYDIDLNDLLDDVMIDKQREAEEAGQEAYDRYIDRINS